MTSTKIALNEIIVAIWACSSFYVTSATQGENPSLLFVPLIVGAAALSLLAYKKPIIATVSPVVSVGVLLLNLSILASYLFNAQRYDWLFISGNIASSLLLFFSLYLITTRIDLDFRKTLIINSVLVNLLLPIVLFTAPVTWGRVNPPTTPNYVAMMALLAFIGALGVRSIIWAVGLSIVPLYSMVVLQSRDSLLAAAIAVLFALASWLWCNRFSKRFSAYLLLACSGAVVLCAALCLARVPILESIQQTTENLFLVNDKYRGLASGGSGRDDLWAAAISLWQAQPLFGVGFKGHILFMPDQLPAHNAYIAMLADLGLAGVASYVLMISPAIYSVFRPGLPEYPQWATIVLTYLLYGVFETRAFSFGNTYSIMFMLAVFGCSKRWRSDRKCSKLAAIAFFSRIQS
jgi:O-antigen ligase